MNLNIFCIILLNLWMRTFYNEYYYDKLQTLSRQLLTFIYLECARSRWQRWKFKAMAIVEVA